MQLKNSTILITGGTRGIGLEFVKQIQKLNASDIIITGRDKQRLDEVKASLPNVHIFQSDVSKTEDILNLFTEVTAKFPALNVLINNAGIMRNLDLQDESMDLENITREIDIDLNGPIRMVHQFLPHLKKQKNAAIVNVSSGLAFIPFPASPIYSAAKAGVHAYTKVLRLQLKNTQVKVIELAPPGTSTDLMDDFTGIVNEKQNMAVEKLMQIAIDGIQKGKLEIKPGVAGMLKIFSRIAPNFFLNFMDKSIEKARAKK